MLRICLPHQHEVSTSRNLQSDWATAIGRLLGPVFVIPGIQGFSQEHNDVLSSSGIEPRVDNLAVAYLRSYPLSCTAASLDKSARCLFRRTQQRVIPSVDIEIVINDYYSVL